MHCDDRKLGRVLQSKKLTDSDKGQALPILSKLDSPILNRMPRRLVLGVAENELYVSMGEDAMNLLKICIERSKEGKLDTNANLPIRLLSLAKLAFSKSFDPELQKAYELLRKNDRLLAESRPCENGFAAAIDIEIGFIAGAMAAVQSVGRQAEKEFEAIKRELQVH